ncbi:hypothetical protein Vretimale_2634, partial [Volvox reticuliferus]
MPAFNIDRELNIKTELEETGEAGVIVRFRVTDTWQDIQDVLSKAHDLPIRRPLHPEAYEYHLEALLPPGLQLHPLPPSPQPQPQDDAGSGSGTEPPLACGSSAWGPRLLQVTDEGAWRRLQQSLPGSRAELATWQLKASASEAKSAAYVRHLEGYTGMWEIAVATSGASLLTAPAASAGTANGILGGNNTGKAGLSAPDSGGSGVVGGVGAGGDLEGSRAPLDGVWSEEEVVLLVRCLAEFMRKGHLERVGAVAAGCCSLATLWWLLKQPNARVRPSAVQKGPRITPSEPAGAEPVFNQQQLAMQSPRVGAGNGEGAGLDSGHDPGALPGGMIATGGPAMTPPSQQQQQPAAAFRLQLRKKDRGARPLAALDGRSVGGGVNTGGGTGANSTLMALLLSPNLLSSGGAGAGGSGYVGGVSRAVSLMMRDILNRVATTGQALLRQYKGNQVALAAVWGVGLLSEMFRNPLLRGELMVAAQLGASQALAAAGGSSSGAGGTLITGLGSPQKRRAALAGDSSSGGGAAAGAEGRRAGPSCVPAMAGPSVGAGGSNLLGIDLEEVHWLLLSFAAFPEWLEARSGPPWDLQPMARAHAATVIQSSIRGLVARRQTRRLQSQVSRVYSFRASVASPPPSRAASAAIAALQARGQSSKRQFPTAAPTPAAQQPPRPAVAAPIPRPRGLSLKWEGELASMAASAIDAIDRYFDLPPGSHPGVVAAEALLAVLVSGGPLAREHFAASVHPGQLIRMLDTATVPPRVVHLGAVLLALALRPGLGAEAFFRGAGAAAVAAAQGPPGSALGPCFAASSDRTMLAAVGSGGLGLVLELLRWLAPLTA